MRYATFTNGSGPRVGVVSDDDIVDLGIACPQLPRSLAEILNAGDDAFAAVKAAERSDVGRLPLSAVRLAAPIPRPSKFFGVGLNYADHVAEAHREVPSAPTVFSKMSSCVVGPYDDIQCPIVSVELDYEGELGMVIGRRCRHISPDDAPHVIAGYLIVNDVSVRDWQHQTSQWTLGKSFDTHGPMGPFLVTPDELGDPHTLAIRTLVNGEIRQEANTGQMTHNCFELVAHLSKVCSLGPGDVITTGTPAGVAAVMKPPKWLIPGDIVRVEIHGLGFIENRVVAETPPSEGAWSA